MFKYFGHRNVFILNGGLQQWHRANLPTETTGSNFPNKQQHLSNKTKAKKKTDLTPYTSNPQPNLVVNAEQVLQYVHNGHAQIIDARGKPRYDGQVSETRKGVRSGHIPTSLNVPFDRIVQEHDYSVRGTLKC